MRRAYWPPGRTPQRGTAARDAPKADGGARESVHSFRSYRAAQETRRPRDPAYPARADEPERCWWSSWLVPASGLTAWTGGRASEQLLRLEQDFDRSRDVRGGI